MSETETYLGTANARADGLLTVAEKQLSDGDWEAARRSVQQPISALDQSDQTKPLWLLEHCCRFHPSDPHYWDAVRRARNSLGEPRREIVLDGGGE